MSRGQELIKSEKDRYGKVYVDINYAIDNTAPFIDEKKLKEKKFTSRLSVLKKYIELLESAEREESHKGFLDIFKGDHTVDLLESYKRDNAESLRQLEKCSQCQCLNCVSECKFDVCLGCRSGAHVVKCDHGKINVVFHDNFTIDLTNDKTGQNEKYKVMAILQDVVLDRRYIIIEGIHTREKFILYYYPGVSEDTYGEITDEKEFDFIVSTYEGIER